MPIDRLEAINHNSNFYRSAYKNLIVSAFVLIIVNFILIGAIFFIHLNQGQEQYFMTATDGKLLELKPIQ